MLRGISFVPTFCFPALRGISSAPAFSLSAFGRISSIRMVGAAGPVIPIFTPLDDGGDDALKNSDGFRFRFVSYNILAQVYVKSVNFPHSPSSCLKWKARSLAVLTDLKNLNADFLCVQELDEYDNFYKGNMEKLGYSSIYVQRTGQKRDGCGIFYKHKSAELMFSEEIHYNDLVDTIDCKNGSTDIGIVRSLKEVAKEAMASEGTLDHVALTVYNSRSPPVIHSWISAPLKDTGLGPTETARPAGK